MLTKDQLKFTVRGQRVYPKYISPLEAEVKDLAAQLIELYQASVGMRFIDLKERISDLYPTGHPLLNAFCKLLDDRCVLQEDDEEVQEKRWQILELAQQVRQSLDLDTSHEQFLRIIASTRNEEPKVTSESIYADLADQKKILEFLPQSPSSLLHRYNCAQIQGLLLRAKVLEIELPQCDLTSRRRLFQKIKFHRLLVEVSSREPLVLKLSGPMSLFEASQTYGSRLANFFPYVLHMKDWKINAELRLNGKDFQLDVSSKRPIASHYEDLKGYIPEEYQNFISLFQNKFHDERPWRIEAGQDFVHLGKQSYCFPDFELQHESGKKIYIELFHQWHKYQLLQRLESIESSWKPQLLIGICQSLKMDGKMDEKLKEWESSGIRIFRFRGFPTPKAVLTQLA